MLSASPNFITIVSGLPRSGTSLLMQMLLAGGWPVLTDQVRAADEDNPKGYLEFEAVKQTKTSRDWLAHAQGKAVKMVHLLLLQLPTTGYTYRVLLMKRKIAEVTASQRAMLQRQNKRGANLTDQQLGQLFLSQLAQVENWLIEQPEFSVLPVNYNELVANPAPLVEKINQFLGGNLNAEAMIQTVDAKLYRQRA
ncbi:MAG: sulfotransferase [Verrucomicrobiota bacterium]|nr:sulfotransferase [Verrucomicrobiota bacterium]